MGYDETQIMACKGLGPIQGYNRRMFYRVPKVSPGLHPSFAAAYYFRRWLGRSFPVEN
jgi:hypothetical protein